MIDIGSQIDNVYCLYLNNILEVNESISSDEEYDEFLNNHELESNLFEFSSKKISYNNNLQDISIRKGMESKLTSDPEKGNLFFSALIVKMNQKN